MNEKASAVLAALIALSPEDRAVVDRARAALGAEPVQPPWNRHAGDRPPPVGRPSPSRFRADPLVVRPRLWDAPFDPDLFMSNTYKAQVGTESALCYIGCLEALAALARDLGACVFKLGVTAAESVHARIRALSEARYGCCWKRDGRFVEDPGFDAWQAASIGVERGPVRHSPVRVDRRFLTVALPAGMSMRMLDRALARFIEDHSVAGYARTSQGIERCASIGADPARFVRYTPARSPGGGHELATELIMGFAPRRDGDALVRLIEAIVARHVLRAASPVAGADDWTDDGRARTAEQDLEPV